MALVSTEQVAQDIFVMKSLHPDDKLSVTMARLPYTMLTKVTALAHGNQIGMFKSDRAADTLELADDYEVHISRVSDELRTVLDQMTEMATLYAEVHQEHVSVGQFCVWAQIGPEFFPVVKYYAEKFYDESLAFYSLENPYSQRGHVEEFIATPATAKEQWGAKQFTPPKPKHQKQANKAKNKKKDNK